MTTTTNEHDDETDGRDWSVGLWQSTAPTAEPTVAADDVPGCARRAVQVRRVATGAPPADVAEALLRRRGAIRALYDAARGAPSTAASEAYSGEGYEPASTEALRRGYELGQRFARASAEPDPLARARALGAVLEDARAVGLPILAIAAGCYTGRDG